MSYSLKDPLTPSEKIVYFARSSIPGVKLSFYFPFFPIPISPV